MANIDVLGVCPACEYDWNGGDIAERIHNIRALLYSDTDLPSIIAQTAYGVNKIAVKSFSKLKVTNFPYQKLTVYTCPNIMCNKTFDIHGVEFNLKEFKQKKCQDETTENKGESFDIFNHNEL